MICLALFAFLTVLSSAKIIPRSTIEILKQASEKSEVQVGDLSSIPGTPWEDYPAYRNVPLKSYFDFSCSSRTDGGYYADSDFGCQVFHICAADGAGGLARYDFVCPIGTIFNQEYYICDWWFNFDCPNSEEATWKTSGPDTEVVSGYYDSEDNALTESNSLETNVGGGYSHGSNINNKPNAAQPPPGTVNPCELCKDIPDGTMTSGCADWFQGMGQVATLENIYAAGKDFCMWSTMEVATAGRKHSGRKEQQSGEKAVHASKEIMVGEKMKLAAAENSRLRKMNLALLKTLQELN